MRKSRFSLRILSFQLDFFYNKSLKQLQIGVGKRNFYTPIADEHGNTKRYKKFEIRFY